MKLPDRSFFSHPPTARSAGRILVVDDIDGNIVLLRHLLEPDGYEVIAARDGRSALDLVAQAHPDVILCDIRMPGVDGFGVCRELKAHPATRLIPVVLMTAISEQDDRIRALDAGADDFLCKPFDPTELAARVRSLTRLKRFTDDLDSAEGVLRSLARMIELRDVNTNGHCERLSAYASMLGGRLNLPEDDILALQRGGYFHDIGKIGIPDAILLKPGGLTVEEYDQMKQHTVIGDRLCGELRTLSAVRSIVRSHHERLDGSGYPDGLKGSAIPLLAQIIGIVDVYDAITTARPYKPALSCENACEQLQHEALRGWRDPVLVDVFITAALDERLGASAGHAN